MLYDGPAALAQNYAPLASAMTKVVNYFQLSDKSARFSLVQILPKPYIVQDWSTDTNQLARLIRTPVMGRSRATAASLLDKLMTSAQDRPAKTIVVFFTNRQRDENKDSEKLARKLKKGGASIFVVAIGDDVSRKEVNRISSSPNGHYVMKAADFAELDRLALPLAGRTCEGHTSYCSFTYRYSPL